MSSSQEVKLLDVISAVGYANETSRPNPSQGPTLTSAAAVQPYFRLGDGSGTIFYIRVLVNAGDDTEAQTALSNGYPDVTILRPGESIAIFGDGTAITRLDIVAVGSAETTTPVEGELVVENTATSTAADYGTAMVSWTFDSADDVQSIVLHASDRQSNDVTVHVEGRSYA